MVTACRPIRETGGLPPRRSDLIQASSVAEARTASNDWGMSINVPLARDRMLEYFEREQLPGDVKSTLAAALNGDLHYQHLLFTAMLDTWPKLQKAIAEIGRKVSVAPWKVHPFAKRGEKPTSKAEADAKEFEWMIWGMKPRAQFHEKGFEDTVKDIVRAYYYGHGVYEIRWARASGNEWNPRCTKTVPARFYGYPYDIDTGPEGEDRLMFDREGGMGARRFEDFPEHRFLIAINAGHGGHPSVAAPLRALAGYWLAAVYGLKWFINFTQLFGIPWRHAEVGDTKDENAVKTAIASIGANGYIITKPGTKINILADASTSGQSLPQRELIALADQQCDQFILGQTLTGGVDKNGGSRALGEVHQEVRDDVIDGVADFVGGVLTHQLIPAVAALNWGDSLTELPEIWAKREDEDDTKANAERMEIVTRIGVPMAEAYVYEELGIPIPGKDEKLFEPAKGQPDVVPPIVAPNGAPVNPVTPGKSPGNETKAKAQKTVEAADNYLEWCTFPDELGSLNIPRAEMPQIKSGDRAAMVQFLRSRGIDTMQQEVDPATLKPSQAEYSPDKVDMARNYKGGSRSILVSEDNCVVDGHHQWRAALEDGMPIKVIRIMAPITRVLMMVHRMPSTSVAAADASGPLTVDQLSESVLEGLTGVSREWLAPVRPFFDRLAALAMSKQVTDEDFLAALEKAQTQLPEIFDLMDTEALQSAFEAAIGSAALAGSVSR